MLSVAVGPVQSRCCAMHALLLHPRSPVSARLPTATDLPSLDQECWLPPLQFSFVVSNARAADLPIVFASPGFFECTGYSPSEVLGRNCRFLQGEAALPNRSR